MSDQASDTLPLAGVRVLEFCHTIMGPSAGVLLADLGADVIKIEAAPDGDSTRRMRGFGTGFFYAFNRNKRSLAVDLKSDQGRELIYKLAENADVVLENFGPGTMDRLKCGYDDLSAINPRLIYCALKGFLSGPYEHRPALDEVVQYMSDNTALSLHEIQTETDRYISWPGQALSYKIGELKIRALREKAQEALGTSFDIRDFHELILGQGTVSLSILEDRVLNYIQKAEIQKSLRNE